MRILIVSIVLLLFSTILFAQKKNKQLNFITKEHVLGDSIIIERIPLGYLFSNQKYFIDALQKQLDEAKLSIKSDSIVDEDLITTINNLIVSIKKEDPTWKSENYSKEAAYYSNYKIAFEDESNLTNDILKSSNLSTFKNTRVIHTGPRGGKYYINSNGNKTYVKKKN